MAHTAAAAPARVDVLAALGDRSMETSYLAAKCGVSNAVALRALRAAEAAGTVEGRIASDARYHKRGSARPIIWQATTLAQVSP